ncbi:type IV toxin-antitoxin system AbiEi family antitoxin [Marinomonas primoryensis]|uniref:type IV toxin-antitoxin system AbiEi family antitoxin n=1 Tax=Marinomonas primoryensis TaxID=178399 RepID=UPI0030D7A34B|tara:strand:- start:424 stop:948 length:525 start_codon:yes stop_codon:yes gene_type:complete
MRKKEKLLSVLSHATKAGGGVHTATEIAFMLGEKHTPSFTKFLTDRVQKGVLRRVATGIFESTITPPDGSTAIYKIVNKLRGDVLNYISLESQLSYTGDISQIVIDRLTVMTKGRSGIFSTPYGVIEFTHTKKTIESIAPNIYFDSDIKMYRARTSQAIVDLKNCNRNLQMLEA